MGFSDFLGDAVRVVKDFVVNPADDPIIGAIKDVAGVVAHAIPGVGPVFDVAVPALQGIFSDGSSPTPLPADAGVEATPPRELLDQPLVVNLRHSLESIDKLLDKVTNLNDNLSSRIQEVADKVDDGLAKLLQALKHDSYVVFKGKIASKIAYFKRQHQPLAALTASSPDYKFKQILEYSDGSGTLPSERKELKDAVDIIRQQLLDGTWVPSEDLVNLYILGVHWLLVFDKVGHIVPNLARVSDRLKQITGAFSIIVTRGLIVKSYQAHKLYTVYLTEISRLNQNISDLRADAKEALSTIKSLVNRLTNEREKQWTVVSSGSGEVRGAGLFEYKDLHLAFKDAWQPLAIGWLPVQKMYELAHSSAGDYVIDGEKAGETGAASQLLGRAQVAFYQEIAIRNLEVKLMPCRATIESLTENLRQWNSRLPVFPVNLVDTSHVKAELAEASEEAGPKVFDDLVGKELRYLVTYVNAFGEGLPSALSPPITIEKNNIPHIKLTVHDVLFEGDPMAGVKPIEADGKLVPAEKGIRRRVYVQYKTNDDDETYKYVGEISEKTNVLFHDQ